ncbi:MAG: indolepyruvate ferredoxin oxidoreductase [Phycisphaerae bacterium]|jgi:indolepyruvate ferredoxin oxidoreductase alpha subunit
MNQELLLGDEAVALGAIDAGIGGAFSYPGTPATEIMEFVQQRTNGCGTVSALWSANEKVAYEEALGMSYAGKRALAAMKHVGLNVAADPFVSSALTGVNAGLVLAVADDPGMHSSQNEQDSRYYSEFARIPCLEPANQQECYDFTRAAFTLSEQYSVPVMIRLVTRLAHSRANVRVGLPEAQPHASADGPTPPKKEDWTLIPTNARRRFLRLIELQPKLAEHLERSPYNRLTLAGRRGIVAAGVAWNYVREALGGDTTDSLLKIGSYPLPIDLIRKLVDHCEEILVVEDGYPFIESRLLGLLGVPGRRVRGRLDGLLPVSGELTPETVAAALGRPVCEPALDAESLPARPPSLCKGCPHADTFKALLDATRSYPRPLLFSDIGCYTLGCMPPYDAVHTCVDMGASISMAHGAAQAGAFPVICTIGDSTFTHSGITGLLGAARSDADMTVIILDNGTTGMTGGQETLACGEELVNLIRGLGVHAEHLHVIEPLARNHAPNVELISREISHRGLSVIVARRACIQIRRAGSGAGAAPRGGTHVQAQPE